MFWSVAQPLVMMTTVAIAFVYILRIPIPNFTIFYLSAAVLWNFLTASVMAGTGALHSRVGLVKRTNFPLPLMPTASVLSQIIGLGMETLLLLAFYFVFPDGYRFSAAWLFLPVLALITMVLATGVSFVTAPLSARYRDVDYIVQSAFTLGFWLSPILYSTSMAPPWLARLLRLNPAAGILEGAREIVMQGRMPDLVSLVPALVAATVFFIFGAAYMRKANLTAADYL
jgi:ABC-type polysaccharide/polyol phosphate export permease